MSYLGFGPNGRRGDKWRVLDVSVDDLVRHAVDDGKGNVFLPERIVIDNRRRGMSISSMPDSESWYIQKRNEERDLAYQLLNPSRLNRKVSEVRRLRSSVQQRVQELKSTQSLVDKEFNAEKGTLEEIVPSVKAEKATVMRERHVEMVRERNASALRTNHPWESPYKKGMNSSTKGSTSKFAAHFTGQPFQNRRKEDDEASMTSAARRLVFGSTADMAQSEVDDLIDREDSLPSVGMTRKIVSPQRVFSRSPKKKASSDARIQRLRRLGQEYMDEKLFFFPPPVEAHQTGPKPKREGPEILREQLRKEREQRERTREYEESSRSASVPPGALSPMIATSGWDVVSEKDRTSDIEQVLENVGVERMALTEESEEVHAMSRVKVTIDPTIDVDEGKRESDQRPKSTLNKWEGNSRGTTPGILLVQSIGGQERRNSVAQRNVKGLGTSPPREGSSSRSMQPLSPERGVDRHQNEVSENIENADDYGELAVGGVAKERHSRLSVNTIINQLPRRSSFLAASAGAEGSQSLDASGTMGGRESHASSRASQLAGPEYFVPFFTAEGCTSLACIEHSGWKDKVETALAEIEEFTRIIQRLLGVYTLPPYLRSSLKALGIITTYLDRLEATPPSFARKAQLQRGKSFGKVGSGGGSMVNVKKKTTSSGSSTLELRRGESERSLRQVSPSDKSGAFLLRHRILSAVEDLVMPIVRQWKSCIETSAGVPLSSLTEEQENDQGKKVDPTEKVSVAVKSALENAEDFFIVLSSVLDVLTSPAAMGELSLGCLGPVASSQVLSRPVSRGSRTGERKAMTITTGFKSEGSLGDFFAEGGAKTSPLEPALTISNGKAQSFWAEQFPNDYVVAWAQFEKAYAKDHGGTQAGLNAVHDKLAFGFPFDVNKQRPISEGGFIHDLPLPIFRYNVEDTGVAELEHSLDIMRRLRFVAEGGQAHGSEIVLTWYTVDRWISRKQLHWIVPLLIRKCEAEDSAVSAIREAGFEEIVDLITFSRQALRMTREGLSVADAHVLLFSAFVEEDRSTTSEAGMNLSYPGWKAMRPDVSAVEEHSSGKRAPAGGREIEGRKSLSEMLGMGALPEEDGFSMPPLSHFKDPWKSPTSSYRYVPPHPSLSEFTESLPATFTAGCVVGADGVELTDREQRLAFEVFMTALEHDGELLNEVLSKIAVEVEEEADAFVSGTENSEPSTGDGRRSSTALNAQQSARRMQLKEDRMRARQQAIINATDKAYGLTPLHVACLSRAPVAVEALLRGGADPKAETRRGETPMNFAVDAFRKSKGSQKNRPTSTIDESTDQQVARSKVTSREGSTQGNGGSDLARIATAASEESGDGEMDEQNRASSCLKTLVHHAGPSFTCLRDLLVLDAHFAIREILEAAEKWKREQELDDHDSQADESMDELLTASDRNSRQGQTRDFEGHFESLYCDSKGHSLLHYCTFLHCVEAIPILVEFGANPDFEDHNGFTPMHFAVAAGNAEAVVHLLRAGTNKDLVDHNGNTYLHYLVEAMGTVDNWRSGDDPARFRKLETTSRRHWLGVLLALTHSSMHMEGRNVSLSTPFAIASAMSSITSRAFAYVEEDREEVGEGSDRSREDLSVRGRTELPGHVVEGIRVANYGLSLGDSLSSIAMLALLLRGCDFDCEDLSLWTPLHYAIRFGKEKMVELLLAIGADPNKPNETGHTPLHLACQWGLRWSCEALLLSGASPNRRDQSLDTPLHAAIVTATVVQSKEVPSTGPRGKLACLDGPHERQAGALQCVELLCRYGADTALQDKMGVSSLHAVATLPGLLKMVLLSISKAHPLEDALFKGSMGAPSGPVLRSDADATLEGYHRSSGLNSESIPENSQQERSSAGLMGLAKKSGEEKVDARKSRSRVLANIRDIHGRTPLHKAAIAGSATVWNLLREAGSLPDVLDKDGRSALHYAVALSQLDAIQCLIDSDADPNIVDVFGLTALQIAVSHRTTEATLLLLRSKAIDVDCAGGRGWSPLLIAAADGLVSEVTVLLDRGADPSFQGPKGMTPLHWAAKKGHGDVVSALLKAGSKRLVRTSEGKTAQQLAERGGFRAIAQLIAKFKPAKKPALKAKASDK